eukprot:m.13032 g.13032  ORF g.13032 m.13032 type:complete len:379 (+) comp4096_c0_seq1:50-1186(+)
MLGGVVLDDAVFLQKLFNRYVKADFAMVVDALGFKRRRLSKNEDEDNADSDDDNIDEEDNMTITPEEYKTKAFLIQEIVRKLLKRGGLRHNQLAELDLLHVRVKNLSRKWKCFKATHKNLQEQAMVLTPSLIEERCSKFLDVFPNHVKVDKSSQNPSPTQSSSSQHLTLRIYIGEGVYKLGSSVFACILPGENVFACTAMPKHQQPFITHAIAQTLGYLEVEETDMDGGQPESLIDLLVNQHSQGHMSMFRDGLYNISPLDRSQLKKPKVDVKDVPLRQVLVVDDEHGVHAVREEEFNIFGTSKPPTLQRIEFEMETKLKVADPMDCDALIECAVKMEGKDVLNGIKNLGRAKLITGPLPDMLTAVLSAGTNHIQVKE